MKTGESGSISIGNKNVLLVERNSNPSYDKIFHFFDDLILNELSILKCQTWIAGGAIREYFLNKEITTDIDLYFNDDKNYELAKNWFLNSNFQPVDEIAAAFNNKFKKISQEEKSQLLKEIVNRPVGKIILENNAALKIEYKNVKIDLVKKYRPNPILTIETFDFTVTMAALDYNTFYCCSSYFVDLINKDLIIQNFHNPLSTLHRLQKYIKFGFTISKENMFELAKNIKSTPIAEINPIEFQLDQLENPNGVVEVDRPIRRNIERIKITASTSGYGMYGGEEEPTDEQIEEHEPIANRRLNIIERIFERKQEVTKTYDGY